MQQTGSVEPVEPVHSGVEMHLQRLRDAVARGSLPDARSAAAATRASLSALGPVGAEDDTISSRLVEEVAELLVDACKNAEKPVLPLIAAELCRVHPSVSHLAVTRRGTSALMYASHHGWASVVTQLIQAGQDVNGCSGNGNTALSFAAARGNVGICSLLLQKGAKTEARDSSGRTPLYVAAKAGHDDAVDLLLSMRADPAARTSAGSTPLHVAAEGGFVDVCRTLLCSSGAVGRDIANAADKYGATPYISAAMEGRTAACRELARHGARVDAATSQGITALMAAIDNRHVECARFLMEDHAVDIHARNTQGADALSYACKRGMVEVAVALVQRGSSVNSKNLRGTTVLMVAANNGCEDICTFLLDNGADICARNQDGATVFDCAATASLATHLLHFLERHIDMADGEDEREEGGHEKEEEECKTGGVDRSLSPRRLLAMQLQNFYDMCEAEGSGHEGGEQADAGGKSSTTEDGGNEGKTSDADDDNAIDGKTADAPSEDEDAADTSHVMQAFMCPITCSRMRDPVTCMDGHTYEREAIERWLSDHDTSPLTGAELPSKMLVSNYALRNAIEEFADKHMAAAKPTPAHASHPKSRK